MYKAKIGEISHKIRTTSSDWLFSNIFSSDQKDKVKLYADAYIHLSLILTIMDWADEGTNTDVMDIVLSQMVTDIPNELKPLHQKFIIFKKWLETGKSQQVIEAKELKGLITLQIVENHLCESQDDKPIAFTLLDKTKSDFNEILKTNKTRVLSIYGAVLYCLLHARLIDPKSDDHTEIAYKLLLRGHEKVNELLPKIHKWKQIPFIEKIFLKDCYTYAARIEVLMESDPKVSLKLLKKAIFLDEIKDPQLIINHPDLKEFIIQNKKIIPRFTESRQEIEDRIAFKKDFRKYSPATKDGKTLNASIIQQSLTESQLSNTLSRSTVNFLTDPLFPIRINLRDLIQPVINNIHNEAKNRLNERLNLYGVKALREIPGDGNCQMYSLSDQFCGNLKHAKYIRRTLVNWLRLNAEIPLSNGCTLKDFVHDQTWDNYCAKMLKDGEWGDHLTLIAAAEVFKAKIFIISSIPGDNYTIEIIPTFKEPVRYIMLSHYAEYHYGSVHPIIPNK